MLSLRTKIAQVIELLQGNDGATLAELVAATGWLPHTARAALTGLRKRGYAVGIDRTDKARGSVYRNEPTAMDGDSAAPHAEAEPTRAMRNGSRSLGEFPQAIPITTTFTLQVQLIATLDARRGMGHRTQIEVVGVEIFRTLAPRALDLRAPHARFDDADQHWRRWLSVESRRVVPFTSFAENEILPNGSRRGLPLIGTHAQRAAAFGPYFSCTRAKRRSVSSWAANR